MLPSLRETGVYAIKSKKSFNMETEYDLHSKVVRFIRKFCPDTLMTVSLDNLQDISSKRIKKGSPDIVIQILHKKYNGLVIDFKSPNGHDIVSPHQDSLVERYRLNGYKTGISP